MSSRSNRLLNLVLPFIAMCIASLIAPSRGDAADCLACHGDLAKGKSVHAAVQMGCETCHSAIDASNIPHAKTGKVARGLSADVPDLCYTCHDRKKFSGKYIHAPVGIGLCTGCHDPHRSGNAKLLKKAAPDLCFGCHEKSGFSKKNVHAPVAGGVCLDCHAHHSAEEFALLKKEAPFVCLECHGDVRKSPHAVTGFETAGHPLGIARKGKQYLTDPARPGKRFYCGSCHNPHSSDWGRLFRYQAEGTFGLCSHCHKM